MKIAIVFYSKTGNTRRVVQELIETLKHSGFDVNVFEVIPAHDYKPPLHFNPRLIYETLIKKSTSINIKPSAPLVKDYDIFILASPVWFNTITPPIRTFIREYKGQGKTAICITTSQIALNYSRKLRDIAEKEGNYKVIYDVNIVKGEIGRKVLNKITEIILKYSRGLTKSK